MTTPPPTPPPQPRRIDAAHAAAVLTANGSVLPPGVTDAAGFCAYLHPDLAAGFAWWRFLTDSPDITLIAIGMTEAGWMYVYDYAPGQRAAMRR